jgi:hypothetical protein
MEVIYSSETSLQIRISERYVSQDGNIHNYRCENIKSYEQISVCEDWIFISPRLPDLLWTSRNLLSNGNLGLKWQEGEAEL